MKRVREILNEQPPHEVYSVAPDQNVLSAAQFMRAKNIGAVVVMRNNALLGILSERDMLNKVLSPGVDPRDVFVEQIMSRHVSTASPDETGEESLIKMRTSNCRHLPVIENGQMIGMISLRELLGMTEAECLDTYLWNRFVRQEEAINRERSGEQMECQIRH